MCYIPSYLGEPHTTRRVSDAYFDIFYTRDLQVPSLPEGGGGGDTGVPISHIPDFLPPNIPYPRFFTPNIPYPIFFTPNIPYPRFHSQLTISQILQD